MDERNARIDELMRLRKIFEGEVHNPRAAAWANYAITMEQALNHIDDRLEELTAPQTAC